MPERSLRTPGSRQTWPGEQFRRGIFCEKRGRTRFPPAQTSRAKRCKPPCGAIEWRSFRRRCASAEQRGSTAPLPCPENPPGVVSAPRIESSRCDPTRLKCLPLPLPASRLEGTVRRLPAAGRRPPPTFQAGQAPIPSGNEINNTVGRARQVRRELAVLFG